VKDFMAREHSMTDRQDTDSSADEQAGRLLEIVIAALEAIKAVDIRVIDVRGLTSITDRMVIASGTSTRHIKALAENVVLEAKRHGFAALGVEGEDTTGWILVDLSDVVVHIMMPETREFYALEKLWSVGDRDNASA
jgi:ribosome-associated protein